MALDSRRIRRQEETGESGVGLGWGGGDRSKGNKQQSWERHRR